MENYKKGLNVEEPLERDKIPIPHLPTEFIWIRVECGSKMRNLLDYALKEFGTQNFMVWTGCGNAIGKAVSCAEITKRRFRNIYQISKICFRKIEEYWDPLHEHLDPLVVKREIPVIHILLSKEPLNKNVPGYQAPGSKDVVWPLRDKPEKKMKQQRLSSEQFAAMGLRSSNVPKKKYKRVKTKKENEKKIKEENNSEESSSAQK